MCFNPPHQGSLLSSQNMCKKGFNFDLNFQSLHQYVSKFNMCFIRFWMKLDKFTVVKMGNPLVIGD
jgi:hypothetical protein